MMMMMMMIWWCDVIASDGGCGSYSGDVCQSVISRRTTVFIKSSVDVSVTDAVIGRWLQPLDQSTSCYGAAKTLLCHHVYPPCEVVRRTPRARPVCR